MLLFAHTGITLGLARLTELSIHPRKIDYRIVLVGSMLPDLIDKPIGIFILGNVFSNGRIFSHTILFHLVLLLLGLYFYRKFGRIEFLTLFFCSGFHLVLDQMWLMPRTLFWPLYGWTFPKYNLTNWIPNIFEALLRDPVLRVSESMGLIILLISGGQLLRQKRLIIFLRSGVMR